MYNNLEIILGLSFLYTIRCILYKREKPLASWEIVTILCTICWIVLIIDHLNHVNLSGRKMNRNKEEIPLDYNYDPDGWDGTVIYPKEE